MLSARTLRCPRRCASFSAGKGDRTLGVTVYRGDIADAEASVTPPRPDTKQQFTIAGRPAMSTTMAAGGAQCLTKDRGVTVMRVAEAGPCGQQTTELRVSSAPHEQIWVTSADVPQSDIRSMLEQALA